MQRQAADEQDPDQPLARIVLTHLDKYWGHILPDLAAGEHWQRTTNQLESTWRGLKRGRRRTHGRGKLTRDFQSLPEEYLLIPNLQNETYLQLVFGGSLDSLPAKLAEASREPGSFDAWRRRRRPRLVGELPRRLLRQDDFIEHLLDTCLHYCSPAPAKLPDAAPAPQQLSCQPNFGTIVTAWVVGPSNQETKSAGPTAARSLIVAS